MDNTAQGNASKQRETGAILSGVVYGPAALGSNEDVALGGIGIEIKGQSKNTDSQSVITGAGGEFSSSLLSPGKYKIIPVDRQGKYFHPSFSITIAADMELPIAMSPAGEQGKRRRGRGPFGGGWTLRGRVKDRKNKSLAGIEVTIKSTALAPQKGILRNIAAAARV